MSHLNERKPVGFIPQKERGGNTPIYMRQELSSHMLREYPQYKTLYHECRACGKNSLKPIGYKKMSPAYIKLHEKDLDRQCSICGYIHKPSETEVIHFWVNSKKK